MIRNFETLARIPLFSALPEGDVRRLDTQCIWRRARAREYILDYNDGGTDLYFVARGKVRVKIQAISGKESILRDIHDGEFFGELAAIDGGPRSASIVAVTDSTVAKMPPGVFREIVHRRPEVCDRVLALLASQVRMLANRVNEFSTLDVRGRIHAELLRLARPAQAGAALAVISPPPTHAELAARVSCRREAVTRELGALARAGLLEHRRGAIALLDPARLARGIEQSTQ
jgi:CRP/FNR family transcriptional regulator, cyclic AMP receptor protein